VGEVARDLFADAQKILDRIVKRRLVKANAVYGFYPANSVGDDVEIYADESRTRVLKTFRFLRQQIDKAEGRFDVCLADFIAPKASGLKDYVGGFMTTAGIGLDRLVLQLKPITTITARLSRRRWATVWPKRSLNFCTRKRVMTGVTKSRRVQ
jgi:5-methyltetrahydrofolate--homocysteine methyltransferase